jgi:hypothetical protein
MFFLIIFVLFVRAKRMRILQGLSDSSDDDSPNGTSGTPDDNRAQTTSGRMDSSAECPVTAEGISIVAPAEQNSDNESAGCSSAGAAQGRTDPRPAAGGCSGASCRLRADILRDLLQPSPSSDSGEETK